VAVGDFMSKRWPAPCRPTRDRALLDDVESDVSAAERGASSGSDAQNTSIWRLEIAAPDGTVLRQIGGDARRLK
jgi:hypothetical protein